MNWINLKEQQPKEPGPYLVAGKFGSKEPVLVANYVLYGDSGYFYNCPKVSHWMEVPPLPIVDTIQ